MSISSWLFSITLSLRSRSVAIVRSLERTALPAAPRARFACWPMRLISPPSCAGKHSCAGQYLEAESYFARVLSSSRREKIAEADNALERGFHAIRSTSHGPCSLAVDPHLPGARCARHSRLRLIQKQHAEYTVAHRQFRSILTCLLEGAAFEAMPTTFDRTCAALRRHAAGVRRKLPMVPEPRPRSAQEAPSHIRHLAHAL